ncbi:protein zer-1 homolog [Cimex lectularius]|uniref:Protein zer-1 homolog n=1 Tax=Cimex lectularius TaxID=79782 RepID=A0A8I6RM27_CIMLE|nr:protein zer-1 homolog [Cimex lectularius]
MYSIVCNSANEPDSLLSQCFKFVVRNLDSVFVRDPASNGYELVPGQAFPREICEELIRVHQQVGLQVNDKFVRLFRDLANTKLLHVRLRNSNITDDGLSTLLKHRLVELDIAKCHVITDASLNELNLYGERLESLSIGAGVQLLPDTLCYQVPPQWGAHCDSALSYEERGYILKAPNLRRLAVKNLYIHREKRYFPLLLESFPNLVELDLSGCSDVENLEYIVKLVHLQSLVLHNIFKVQESLPYICQLKSLRHLDISQSSEKMGLYQKENEALAYIVDNLPNLTSLDISGTNLAGRGVAEQKFSLEKSRTDIPGLASRVDRPLEFLGLYGTLHGACRRHDIPAKHISGDANERQILVAAASYLERPDILQRVLNDLYLLFRYDNCQDIKTALAVVLEAMDRHVTIKHIQISGSATLFYIVKSKDTRPTSCRTKQAIITTLLNGMNTHRNDDTMLRNGCLTLCQFKIPSDVLFEYKRLVSILLHIVSEMEQEGFVQRIGIYLLNSLACQVEGSQKQLLGDLGAINRMLVIINNRVTRKSCDDVLEVAWSTMWNVTDETAVNCQRFLDGKGMQYFLGCLKMFPDKDELMRNMMGLLGNVAEVKHLRPRLMTTEYISVFADLVDSTSDGIEVSYNAAGVLSHMASDGPKAWTITVPSRETVLRRMVAAIERWPLETLRNINYRSFEPILLLAKVSHTPECQHWAVWALANLTMVYPDKYCSLVEAEGGIAILTDIINDTRPYKRIRDLAEKVITVCELHRNRSSYLNFNVESNSSLQLDG